VSIQKAQGPDSNTVAAITTAVTEFLGYVPENMSIRSSCKIEARKLAAISAAAATHFDEDTNFEVTSIRKIEGRS